MTCESLEHLLLDLLYEELEETEAKSARAHAESCPACEQKLHSFGQVRRAASGLSAPPMPSFKYTALLAEAEIAARKMSGEKEESAKSAPAQAKEEERAPSFWASFSQKLRFLLSPPVAVAAALTLLLGSSFLLLNNSAPEKTGQSAKIPAPVAQNMPNDMIRARAEAKRNKAADEGFFAEKEAGGEVALESDVAPTTPLSAPPPAEPAAEKPKDAPLVVARADIKPPAPTAGKPVSPRRPGKKSSLDLDFADDFGLGGPKKDNSSGLSSLGEGVEGGAGGKAVPPPSVQSIAPSLGVGYDTAVARGEKAYKGGQYEEAARAYEEARNAALPDSPDFTAAAKGQVRAEISSGDCAGAESAALLLPPGNDAYAEAVFSVADCYQQKGALDNALRLYQKITSSEYTTSTKARRRATTLETKLSKPTLSGDEEPPKGQKKKPSSKKKSSSKSSTQKK